MSTPRFRLLVGLFTRRFFENDLLAPDIDLRPSAIWLMGALALPAALWTVKRAVPFSLMSVLGYDIMETTAWFDRSLLLMLAIVNAAIVTVLCWEALLVDRRDALILGSLPVPQRVVIAAKAAAIARLFAVVAALCLPSIAVHSVSVYADFGGALILRGWAAHTIAAAAATWTTCLVLTAALVTVTSMFDGRWLRTMTAAVQILVLAGVTALILSFQSVATAVLTAARSGGELPPWALYWPPAWFVGLFQRVLGVGMGEHVFAPLAGLALIAMAAAVCVCAPATWLLWRRAFRVLVSAAPGEAPSRGWSLAPRLSRWLARAPLERAFVHLMFAVLWRSSRHRLAGLTAGGLAIAMAWQGTLILGARPPGAPRYLTEFAVPLLAMLVLATMFRWLLTLPAELPASWVVGLVTPVPGLVVRRAAHRVLLVTIVVPAVALALGLSWWQGGWASALAHAAFVLLASLVLVEHAITRVTFIPCATDYLPGRSNLKARWPVHAVVLLFVVPTVSQIERALLVSPGEPFAVTAAIGLAALAAAWRRRTRLRDVLLADPGTGSEWTPVALRIGWAG